RAVVAGQPCRDGAAVVEHDCGDFPGPDNLGPIVVGHPHIWRLHVCLLVHYRTAALAAPGPLCWLSRTSAAEPIGPGKRLLTSGCEHSEPAAGGLRFPAPTRPAPPVWVSPGAACGEARSGRRGRGRRSG